VALLPATRLAQQRAVATGCAALAPQWATPTSGACSNLHAHSTSITRPRADTEAYATATHPLNIQIYLSMYTYLAIYVGVCAYICNIYPHVLLHVHISHKYVRVCAYVYVYRYIYTFHMLGPCASTAATTLCNKWVCGCVGVCASMRLCICVSVRLCICSSVRLCVCACVRLCVRMCACARSCPCPCACACACVLTQ